MNEIVRTAMRLVRLSLLGMGGGILHGSIGDESDQVQTAVLSNMVEKNGVPVDPLQLTHAWGHYILRNIDIIQPCGCSFADACLLINLDKRPDRLDRCLKQLVRVGIHPTRVPAVWGASLPEEAFKQFGISWNPRKPRLQCYTFRNNRFECVNWKRGPLKYYSNWMNRGQIGCYLSHFSALFAAYQAGLNRVWILEDDFTIQDSLTLIEDAIKEADAIYGIDQWDVLYTAPRGGDGPPRPDVDLPLPHLKEKTSQLISICYHRIGTDSMIWNRSGIEKFLKFFNERGLYGPIDHDIHYIPGLNKLQMKDAVVKSYDDCGTDIQGLP